MVEQEVLPILEALIVSLAEWILTHPELAAVGFIGYFLGKII